MKQLTYLLTIFAGLIFACSNFPPEHDIDIRLKGQKTEIDTLCNSIDNRENFTLFVKINSTGETIEIDIDSSKSNSSVIDKSGRVIDGKEIDIFLFIHKDSLGQIVKIDETPRMNVLSDWRIVLSHYFDKDGKTFAFEKQIHFLRFSCTKGWVRETTTEFYDSDFELIETEYQLVDEDSNPLEPDSCRFLLNYDDYDIFKNVDEYLRGNGIEGE